MCFPVLIRNLLITFVFYGEILKTSSSVPETKASISSVFEGLGFSPVCVASTLSICELNLNAKYDPNNVAETLDEIKASLEELKLKVGGEGNRPRNCHDILTSGDSESGVRDVFPYDCCRERKVVVYCDQTTDGGGWTVVHNRDELPLSEDFYRTWVEYSLGFGNVTGEYFLGLDNIHAMVSTRLMEMRIDLEDFEGTARFAKYGFFHIGDASSKYVLSMGRYSGDAGDDLSGKTGMKFTTHDQDNNIWERNCAKEFRGAGWYSNCHSANLNGYQYVGAHTSYADGINWASFKGHNYSLKKANMKIRPAF